MPENTVSQFKEKVSALCSIFDQLCVSVAAIKIEDRWVSIYTGLILNNSVDSGTFQSRIVKAGTEFIAISKLYSTDALDVLSSEVENGCLTLSVDTEDYQIFFNRVAAGLKSQSPGQPRPNFSNIWRPQRQWTQDNRQYRPRIVIQTTGDRFYELFSSEDSDRISKQLRAHRPAYNGLDGLLQFMGSTHRPGTSAHESLVEIKAVLPFNAVIQDERVVLECPEALAPKLSVLFFFDTHESVSVPYKDDSPLSGRPGLVSVQFDPSWPQNSLHAEAHVNYDGEELEVLPVRHWTNNVNWRVTVDLYFDPDSKLIKQALTGDGQEQNEQKRSEAFEQAIVRLLNLGGIASTWHGTLRHSSKPDLAGYCELPGRRIVLLGECTLEKPSVKLSTIKSRADKLRESIDESVEVLPIVFTTCAPVELDYTEAAKACIALVGRNEIAAIQGLVERNGGAAEIIQQIEQTITLHNFPMVARWARRF